MKLHRSPGMRDHCERGGLALRELTDAGKAALAPTQPTGGSNDDFTG